MKLFLLEPPADLAWMPFAAARPVAELRAGAWRIRERWEAIMGIDASGIMATGLAGFFEEGVPPIVDPGEVVGPALVVSSAFAPEGLPLDPGQLEAARFHHEETAIGWRLEAGEPWDGPHERGDSTAVAGLLLGGTHDLLTALEHLLPGDCADFLTQSSDPLPEGTLVIGDPADVMVLGATVEPGVVFDVRQGAVVLEEGVEVRSGTRLEGPVYAGPGTRILGGFIRATAFGPECRVRGEIAASVWLGYANKAHDGFVGHSIIGRWVNLGAGTTTSNLKNTYGPVRLDLPGRRIETGRTNVGSLIGDHAKTAIGTLLPTGAVIGTGANVFGPAGAPKYVPAFAWGSEGAEQLNEAGFLTIAERVLGRRNVAWTEAVRISLAAIHRRANVP